MTLNEEAASPSPVEVSVVIPTRNRADRLPLTLAGVLAQREIELEVVIVDDGSDPDAAAAYRKLEGDRVRVLRHERSRGAARARNSGIEAARGEWVAFLDDDDLW